MRTTGQLSRVDEGGTIGRGTEMSRIAEKVSFHDETMIKNREMLINLKNIYIFSSMLYIYLRCVRDVLCV